MSIPTSDNELSQDMDADLTEDLDLDTAIATQMRRSEPDAEDEDGARDDAEVYLGLSSFNDFLCFYRFHVGPDRTPFLIHTSRLETNCPALMRRLENMKRSQKHGESDTCGIDIANTQASIFRLFVSHVYSERIPPNVADIELVRLLLFAQTFRCHATASYTISLLLRRGTLTSAATKFLLENFKNDVPLHQLLAEEAARHLTSDTVPERVSELPSFFALLIMRALLVEREVPQDASQPVESQEERIKRCVRAYMHPGSSPDFWCSCCTRPIAIDDKAGHGTGLYNETAVVLVGKEKVAFVVHKGVIARHSEYFRAAFSNNFAETRSGVVELPEEKIEIFAMFLEWLYTGFIKLLREADLAKLKVYEEALADGLKMSTTDNADNVPSRISSRTSVNENERGAEASNDVDMDRDSSSNAESELLTPYGHRHLLASLYAFASRRLIPALGNQIMNFLISTRFADETRNLYSGDLDLVVLAFENLPHSSGLCKFLIDEATYCWAPADNLVAGEGMIEGTPAGFSAGVIRQLLHRIQNPQADIPYLNAVCEKYHEHTDEEEQWLCVLEMEKWYERQ